LSHTKPTGISKPSTVFGKLADSVGAMITQAMPSASIYPSAGADCVWLNIHICGTVLELSMYMAADVRLNILSFESGCGIKGAWLTS